MRYRHDDPRLAQVIADRAARGAAEWPVTPEMLARLAPLLAPPAKPSAPVRRRRRTATAPKRRAA